VSGLVALDSGLLDLELLRQVREPPVQPAGGGVGGVNLVGDLPLHIAIGYGVGDSRGLDRIARAGGNSDGGGEPLRIGPDMAAQIIDHPLALKRRGGRLAAGEPVPGVEPGENVAQPQRGDGGIEFRIVGQLQPVHHRGREIARGDDLNLVLHRGRIGGERRDHRGKVGDVVLAGIQQHRGRTGIEGRQGQRHDHGAQHDPAHHLQDQAAAGIHDADEVGKLKAARRIGRRDVGRIAGERPVRRHIGYAQPSNSVGDHVGAGAADLKLPKP
jgi:hypothetical protein